MSKKKSFSGSTMKLKDFHGGSIPSDLPLPSAPGVSASPSNRVAYDRPMNGAWGVGGRLDHHQRPSRPGSAGGSGDSRGFADDGVPFLPSSTRIGRNFEEDERKPFDASFAPRRGPTFDPDPLRLRQPGAADQKQPQQQVALGRPGSSPAAVPHHLSAEQGLPSAWNGAPAASFSGSGGTGPVPQAANAWGTRKDTSNEPRQQIPSTLPSPAASAARFAQASAIDKISSGRWHTKPLYPGQTAGADVVGSLELDAGSDESNGAYGLALSDQRHIDRIDALDLGYDGYADGRYSYDRVRSSGNLEAKEKSIAMGVDSGVVRPKPNETQYAAPAIYQDKERTSGFPDDYQEGRLGSPLVYQIEGRVSGMHISHPEQTSNGPSMYDGDEQLNGTGKVQLDGRSGGSQGYQQGSTEALERPKLRLLPRSKPLEPSERQTSGGEQEIYDVAKNNASLQGLKTAAADTVRDSVSEAYANQHLNPVDSNDHGQKGSNQVLERPRLNLKPRSLPLEQSAESDEKLRKSVFGGARPRELVLKERGIEVASDDVGQSLPAYSKLEGAKLEGKAEAVGSPRRVGEKGDGYAAGRRSGTERKDFKSDPEKADARKSYQRNDQRQNNARENDRSQDGRPEPDSWRKPVEEPKQEVSAGPSYGKVASAVQLAQVFSKSISDAHHGNSRLISPKGVPSVPFSRLTDSREVYSGPNPRKINGF